MTTIDTKKKLVNFKGEELIAEDKGPVFLGVILSNVCAGAKSNPTLGWVLGKKFATEDEVELKAEEVVFLKSEVKEAGKVWMSGLMCGQVLEILDEKE
jgi:hypothetical protein